MTCKSFAKQTLYFIIVILTITFSIFLRTRNLPYLKEDYLICTDSYRILRQSKQINSLGTVPPTDYQRWIPMGKSNEHESFLLPKILAQSYQWLHYLFPSVTLKQVAILHPVVIFALMLPLYFFLIQICTNKNVALLSTIVLSTTPPLIARTTAGYVDEDTLTLFLFILTLCLYVCSLNRKEVIHRIFLMLASSISMGILGLLWLGAGVLTAIFIIYNLGLLFVDKLRKEDSLFFAFWLIPQTLLLTFCTRAYRQLPLTNYTILILVIPWAYLCLSVVYHVLAYFKTLRQLSTTLRFPLGTMLIANLSIMAILTGLLIFGPNQMLIVGYRIIDNILYPFGRNLVMQWINEMQHTTLSHWWHWYSILFILAIFGACLVCHKAFSMQLFNHYAVYLGLIFSISGILFTPLPRIIRSKDTIIWSELLFITSLLLFPVVIFMVYLYKHHYRSKRPNRTTSLTTFNRDKSLLLLLVWFICGLVLTRIAGRFYLFFTPVLAFLAAFAIVYLCMLIHSKDTADWHVILLCLTVLAWEILICGENILSFILRNVTLNQLKWDTSILLDAVITTVFLVILAGISVEIARNRFQQRIIYIGAWLGLVVLCLSSFAGISGYRSGAAVSYGISFSQRPSVDDIRLHRALRWIERNTSIDAVIAAWWDYGSRINEISNRGTIIDEEQVVPWIQMFAQCVLSSKDEREALTFLKSHSATHIMLTKQDVLNLEGVHKIALNTNSLQCFFYRFLYKGLRENNWLYFSTASKFFYRVNMKKNETDYPKTPLFVDYLRVPITVNEDGEPELHTPPTIVMTHNGQEIQLTVGKVLFRGRLWEFKDSDLTGFLWIDVHCNIREDGSRKFRIASAYYLVPEVLDFFPVQYFLLNKPSKSFKLVYQSEEAKLGDLDVKIWKIHYPEDIKVNSKYLLLDEDSSS